MDIPTLIIAIYGAGLSTVLGIRELWKARRSLKIILESVPFFETYRIVITNPAERPISITGFNLAVKPNKGPIDPGLRPGAYWATEEPHLPPDLPLTLRDGEMAIFWLSDILTDELHIQGTRLLVNVYDAAGRTYSKYSQGEFNPKFGTRSGKFRPNIFAEIRWKIQYWRLRRK